MYKIDSSRKMAEIKIEKKHLYLLVAIMIFLLGVGIIVVNAYSQPIPTQGHGADLILISVPNQGEMTLQSAIDQGICVRG